MKTTYAWGSMEWLAGTEMHNASTISVAKMIMLPDETSESHRHANCEEAILVLRGSVMVHRAGVASLHSVGECVAVPAGVPHFLKNVGEDQAELVLMYGAGARDYEPA